MPKEGGGSARRGDTRAKPAGPPGLPDVDLTTALPGVPDSSDEDQGDKPAKRVKDLGGSPKTAAGGSGGVTLADMQRLLENQSRILQEHQSRQIKEAVAELRQTTSAQIGTIRAEVARHGDYIETTSRPRGKDGDATGSSRRRSGTCTPGRRPRWRGPEECSCLRRVGT